MNPWNIDCFWLKTNRERFRMNLLGGDCGFPPRACLLVLVLAASCGEAAIWSAIQTELPTVESLAGTEACVRPPAVPAAPTLELQAEAPPCRIVAIATGIELRGDLEGNRPGPSPYVVMDNHGRFFSEVTYSFGGEIAVWDSLGKFRGQFGTRGPGPREFGGSTLLVFPADDDSVHVLDGRGLWHVFDPELRWVRSFRLGHFPAGTIHLVPAGILVSAPVDRGSDTAAFHVFRLDGTYSGGRGTTRIASQTGVARRSAYDASAGELWLAPAPASGEGFVLERRTMDGELKQLIRKASPWLPVTGYRRDQRLPEFWWIHVDEAGLLWVAYLARARRADATEDVARTASAAQADFWLEVIDPAAGQVLASLNIDFLELHDPRELSSMPIYPVRSGTRRTWAIATDSLGFTSIRFYDLHLIARPEPG